MARNFRNSGKRPIVSNKEIIDGAFLIVAGGVTTDINLAISTNDYVGTVGTCPIGTSILGFYLEISSNNVDNIVGRTDWYLYKREYGLAVSGYPTPGATGGHDHRKAIYFVD